MSLEKMWININGADRMVICDPEDSLSAVIRRQGLTGTKVGCNAGQCGACSVILNGELVRSCVKKMKNIEDRSKVVTIEGIGTPDNLHPLQQAWITYGGVQCGFCSPGFIVSSKALLDANPNPTREEVRAWFQKHRNICRCTGYKPLVDAVMAAAEVLRGEKTMEDITYKIPADGKAYGTRFPRRESGIARVTGLANYGDDLSLQMPEDTLHLALVIPDTGHAEINKIDYSEALEMPGVAGVITAEDVKGTNRIAFPIGHPRAEATGLERPIICDEKIFKIGDVVAIVAADTREHAREAAKVVKVDYEPLPEYLNQLESILPDSVRIHPDSNNIFLKWPLIKGDDTKEIMETAENVVEGSFYSSREPHLALEPDCAQAYMGADGKLTIQYKSQFLYGNIDQISAGLGVPSEDIRIIENETGGSFGYSVSPVTPAYAAVCAMALERPVSIVLSYPEHQIVTGKRTPSNANVRLAADKDGRIKAFEYQICYESGAYIEYTQILLLKSLVCMGFPYYIPNIRGVSKAAFSNMSYGTTYRAFSFVQGFTSSESIMDMMAEKLGMDPFDFRYLNIARPGETSSNGQPYNEYPYHEMMDMLRPKYEAAKQRAEAESTDKKKRGVGISIGGYIIGDPTDNAKVSLGLDENGNFTNYNTWQDVGQHAENSCLLLTYEALRPMNVPLDKIKLEMNDTKKAPNTGLSGGSRMHYYAGLATIDAANKLMDLMRKKDGTYRTYDEMIAEGLPTRVDGASSSPQGVAKFLDANTGQGKAYHEKVYSLYMAEVEVDTDTGKTKVLKLTCIADVGKVGNLQGVEGQAYGGMSHSVGFALKEEFSDVKKHSTMAGAGILECEEMPDDIELLFHDSYREWGPFGSSGCSENFQSSAHVAILNAINKAAGVRIYELPAKPEKILAALKAKKEGRELKPEKYYLGRDLYDEIEHLQANPIPDEENF